MLGYLGLEAFNSQVIDNAGERGRNRTYNLVIKSRAKMVEIGCSELPNRHNPQRLTGACFVWHYACTPTVSKWGGHKIGHREWAS